MKKIVSLFALVSFFMAFADDTATIKEVHSIPPLSNDQLNIVFLVDTTPGIWQCRSFQEAGEFVFEILNNLKREQVDYNAAFVNLNDISKSHVIIDQSSSFTEALQQIGEFYQNAFDSWPFYKPFYSDYYINALYSLSVFFVANPSFLNSNTRLVVMMNEKEECTGLIEGYEQNYSATSWRPYPREFCNGANASLCERVRTPAVFLKTMFKSRRVDGFTRTREAIPFYVYSNFEGDETRYLALGGGVRFYVVSDFEDDESGGHLAFATQEISRDISAFLSTYEIRLNHFPGETLEVKNNEETSFIRGKDWEYFEPTNTIELYNFVEEETDIEIIYSISGN